MEMSPSSLEKQCQMILEEKGGRIADEARTILLKERSLEELRLPLQYVSEHWRDPLTPSLVILSCEAVGGEADDAVYQAALAMSVMSLGLNLWDDIVDKTVHKRFVPTVLGKFGEGVTLMIGGLAIAKAFSILGEIEVSERKHRTITKLVWNYCQTIARAEAINLKLRKQNGLRPEEKLKIIKMQAVNLETSMKIGALLGNGSDDKMKLLGNFGRDLGAILELKKDFNVSVNLTLELAEKIKNGAFPYALLWAKSHSKKIEQYLQVPPDTISIKEIVEAILETGALQNTMNLLKTLVQKAKLELRINKPIEMLEFFLEAQPKILLETLSTL